MAKPDYVGSVQAASRLWKQDEQPRARCGVGGVHSNKNSGSGSDRITNPSEAKTTQRKNPPVRWAVRVAPFPASSADAL